MENEVITQDALAVCLALRPYIYTWASSHDVRHHAFIHKWRKWDAGGLKRRWRRRGEISWSWGYASPCWWLTSRYTERKHCDSAEVWLCVCVRACASASLLLVFLVQCIHVKRTFSVNSSLFGARVINHSVTAVVVLGAFVQVWLLWEQLPSPTNQLWFCCAERSGQANGRTQERRAALCVLFTCLEKKEKKERRGL